MRKSRKVASVIMCVALIFCLATISVSAVLPTKSKSATVSVISSQNFPYDANVELSLNSKSAFASTSYGAIATQMVIEGAVTYYNSALGTTSEKDISSYAVDTSYASASRSAAANELFNSVSTYHRIVTERDTEIVGLYVSY